MFLSTYDESRTRSHAGNKDKQDVGDGTQSPTDAASTTDSDSFPQPPTPTGPIVHDVSDRPPIAEITGAWSIMADEASLASPQGLEELKLHGKSLPHGFKGLATPELNPMVR